jgi:hypothetical protein
MSSFRPTRTTSRSGPVSTKLLAKLKTILACSREPAAQKTIGGVAPGQELVEAQAGRERALPVPARYAEDAEAVDAPALLVALVELVHEGALPVLELERSPGRRSLRVDEVTGEEVGDRSTVAAVQGRRGFRPSCSFAF